MQSTHTGTVEALSGVPPMNLCFSYLNHQKFLRCILMQGAVMHYGADSGSGKNMRCFPWVESLGIEPCRSYTEYSFRAILSIPEVVDDMRRGMVDFPDEFRPTVSTSCLYTSWYETVDHLLWSCSLYQAERMPLKSQLSGKDLSLCTRDMVALRQCSNIWACLSYFVSIGFHV
jgi:hypothetical protein